MKKFVSVVILTLRLVLGGLMLFAGFLKMRDPHLFAEGVAAFHLFPPVSINLIAMVAPVVEIATGLLSISPKWKRQGALLCSILAVCFIGLFSWAIIQDISVSCSCFGAFGGVTSPITGMVRGGAILLCSVGVYVYEIKRSGQSL